MAIDMKYSLNEHKKVKLFDLSKHKQLVDSEKVSKCCPQVPCGMCEHLADKGVN